MRPTRVTDLLRKVRQTPALPAGKEIPSKRGAQRDLCLFQGHVRPIRSPRGQGNGNTFLRFFSRGCGLPAHCAGFLHMLRTCWRAAHAAHVPKQRQNKHGGPCRDPGAQQGPWPMGLLGGPGGAMGPQGVLWIPPGALGPGLWAPCAARATIVTRGRPARCATTTTAVRHGTGTRYSVPGPRHTARHGTALDLNLGACVPGTRYAPLCQEHKSFPAKPFAKVFAKSFA